LAEWAGDSLCIDCFRRGLGSFMSTGGIPDDEAAALLDGYMAEIVRRIEACDPPPIAGAAVYRDLRRRLGGADVFREVKNFFTESLCGMLPDLRAAVSASPEPFLEALGLAAWGNLIDVAQNRPLPEPGELASRVGMPPDVDEREAFAAMLGRGGTLLILGDNAGETVFDRLALEFLPAGVRAFYAVRPEPVLNDATRLDALSAGIDDFATIISTGMDAPTVTLEGAGPELASAVACADAILAKGQGNLEGLYGCTDPRLFHSLAVKCGVVSRLTGLEVGSAVFANCRTLSGR